MSGGGSSNIEGFATDISVDQGQAIQFKVDTNSSNYRIDIYRLGYYNGMGARKVATVEPSASLPQNQPNCLTNSSTGLVDCGNWAISASWAVPSDAVSGVFIGKLVREDGTTGSNHIPFIVRDDDGGSDLLFQTSDTTWQAYNRYGGNSLYTGSPDGRAYKVSYNRPFSTRSCCAEDWLFNAEYPMIRFLERNGYNVSYFTGIDTARRGAELLEHRAFLSVGHDEYWSGDQRANVEAARAAGVNLAFFSGNEVFWKTRWESSIDGSSTAFRTLVSYKETHANAKIDPSPEWTGTWRDPRFSPPADGGRPENGLTGTIFTVNDSGGTFSLQVPSDDGRMRFWRNTSIASLPPGQVATLPDETLGYEWDEDLDNGFRPAGLVRLSTATYDVPSKLQDYGSSYASGAATHHLTLYRAPSGALVFGAGTIQWSWGLDGEHDRGGAAPDVRMQQATVNLFADMGTQPGTLQAGLVAASASTDTAAPTTTISSPADGSSVPVGTSVAITGTASDTGGGVVGGVEVSVDGGSTWHPATGRESWSYSWIPQASGSVTIMARAADDSANLGGPGPGVTVAVGQGGTGNCPCSIWNNATVPGTILDPDTAAVELGVKFQASADGYVTALRFYKGSQNTGPHVGNLWTRTGTLLATVNFVNESASGWQQQTLSQPVPVTAGTTYVASYHTTVGRYSADADYFAGQGVTNGPLRALADGEDGPNGVYGYGPGGFPTNTFRSENYWVDVVFNQTANDQQPPQVINRFPAANATGVAITTNVTATFDEPVDAASISFELRAPNNVLVPATITYDGASRKATLTPNADLSLSTIYTASVGGARDQAGNVMSTPVTWSFTTTGAPPPPPDSGPGGPILVIASPSNPFTRYYAEILRAEGMNEFAVLNLGSVTAMTLAGYDVAILGEMALNAGQVAMLNSWVTSGGNLITMRPDKQLAGLLGITDASSTLSNAYLQVNTSASPGRGITGQTMQFHGTADRYTLSGATAVATLFSSANTATPNPALTLRGVGTSGGQAAAFTYDLARSIVYTRQGNPAWAGQERDGFAPIRANDMFFPDWIDLNKVAIPQADEQQRLLANLIEHMNIDRKPLPRFWYFPRGENAVVVMTGDDHGNGGTVGRFDSQIAAGPAGCSVTRWECIRSTSYVYANTPMSDAQAAGYIAQGFEVGAHIDTGCADFTPTSLDPIFSDHLAEFAAAYPSAPSPSTNRTHCIVFSDWDTEPRVEFAHGIRLDANYYYWPPGWVADRPGFFTGSGIPMRFAALDGSLIDVYQATTQMTDESSQSYPFTIDSLLDGAIGPNAYYGAFIANMHTDSPTSTGSDAIIASATARGVPIVSARQMLEWVDGRNASSFGSISWGGNTLSFTISVAAGSEGLRAMVPMDASPGRLTGITQGGSPITFSTQAIKGVDYAFFPAQAGAYQATYAIDTSPPVISNVLASPQQGGNATITWTTNEASNSQVDYGTAPGSLTLTASNAASVTSHTVTLTGLTSGTTYYFRVRSADAANNSSVSPPTADPPASFITPLPALTDTTVADFTAGQADAGSYIGESGDGEVLLAPTSGTEFSGSTLPSGWFSTPWQSGGGATVGGGSLVVDGASSGTNTIYSSGRVLEFAATFSGAPHQHVGLGVDFNGQPWAMFSTAGGGGLFARTNGTSTQVPGSWLGSPHLFRIEWTSSGVTYFIDGQQVASHALGIATQLRPLTSDFDVGGGNVSVNWLHMSPYSASGTFTSRVLDAGAAAAWGTATWNADVPSGTTLAISARTGNTATPDGTWSPFTQITSGASVGANARYLQYIFSATSGGSATPVLRDISFQVGGSGPDTTPPTITGVTATPAAAGTSATITWATNEPGTSRVDYGTSAGALNQTVNDAALVSSHTVNLPGLTPGTTYFFRVRSTDAANNEATSPVPASPPASFATTTTDATPPTITGVTATPAAAGTSATITWATDEPSDSRVDFGTAPGSLPLNVSNATNTTAHSMTLTNLLAGTTYYYRVTSRDVSSNVGTSPPSANPPATFLTPFVSFVESTTTSFAAGTLSSTYVSETENGEVILNPTRGAEFGGTSVPGPWLVTAWQTGGSGTVGQGVITLDGARSGTDNQFGAGTGRTVEFVATFSGQANQNAGFGGNFNTRPWAAFGTLTGGGLYARSSVSSTNETNTLIPGSWLGSPHRYRIDWTSTTITFWIDGVQVAQHTRSITSNMRPLASDRTNAGGNLVVNWMRMSPYAASGTFTSRVLDAGSVQRWNTVNWLSDLPAGTTLVVSARTGNTATPGATWSAFIPVPTSGSSVNVQARYLQYRVQVTRSNAATTPQLREIAFLIGG